MSDEHGLITSAQRGDQSAFEELVRQNEKRVYHLAFRMTGNAEDACDLVQEAFIKAWRGLVRFQMESSFSTWIYRLTVNVCIDFLRREKPRRELAMPLVREDGEEERQIDLPDCSACPEQLLEQKEQRRAVEEGLYGLSAEHRNILVLRELEGLSYEEIGLLLQLEPGTVKSRIARARLHLRDILTEGGNLPSGAASKPVKRGERRGL